MEAKQKVEQAETIRQCRMENQHNPLHEAVDFIKRRGKSWMNQAEKTTTNKTKQNCRHLPATELLSMQAKQRVGNISESISGTL